jgi:hypothetical protein
MAGKAADHPDVIARDLGLQRLNRTHALSRDELLLLAVKAYWERRPKARPVEQVAS